MGASQGCEAVARAAIDAGTTLALPAGMRSPSADKSSESLGERLRTANDREHRGRIAAESTPHFAAPQAIVALALFALTPAGCGEEPSPRPEVGVFRAGATVADYVESSCTTSVVLGLSRQIAAEVECMAPGTLVEFQEQPGVVFTGSAVLPYLAPQARRDLFAAVAARGQTIEINSAYRTVAQQYLLYRWWQLGRCGITAAATPGNSNHETGRALDVNNYSSWIAALGAKGWSHPLPNDPVHFDHDASPDLRGMDVHAFQRLWNRNHPEDRIAEDGEYGPATAARLAKAPAEGFAQGACDAASTTRHDARLVAGSTPPEIPPGSRAVVWVELENTGTTTWMPATTRLGTTGPRDRASAWHDPENWISPSRPTGVDQPTAPGEVGRFSFVVRAPEVRERTVLTETFGLVEEGVTWFGPEEVRLELVVSPDVPPPSPLEPVGRVVPAHDAPNELTGGCTVGQARSDTSEPIGLLAVLGALVWGAVRDRRGACSLPKRQLWCCAGRRANVTSGQEMVDGDRGGARRRRRRPVRAGMHRAPRGLGKG